MDINKVVQLKLTRHSFIKHSFTEEYNTVFINNLNYNNYLTELLSVSSLMKKDFDWEGIPDELMLHKRFNNNSYCLLFSQKETLLGWIWANDNFSPLFSETKQILKPNEIYAGGGYLSKTIKRPSLSGLALYQIGLGYFLNMQGKNKLYSYIDTWNHVSINLAYKVGFKEHDFLLVT